MSVSVRTGGDGFLKEAVSSKSGNGAVITLFETADGVVWDSASFVTSSDATTTGQSLVDITGLVVPVLAAATYEIEAVLQLVTSADANGQQFGINLTQTPVSVQAFITGNTTTTTSASNVIIANATANATVLNTTSAGTGICVIKGLIRTHATLASNLSIQHVKPTSGTSTVKVGSSLKVRRNA